MFETGSFCCWPVSARAILGVSMVFILADYYLEILFLYNLVLLSNLHYFSVISFTSSLTEPSCWIDPGCKAICPESADSRGGVLASCRPLSPGAHGYPYVPCPAGRRRAAAWAVLRDVSRPHVTWLGRRGEVSVRAGRGQDPSCSRSPVVLYRGWGRAGGGLRTRPRLSPPPGSILKTSAAAFLPEACRWRALPAPGPRAAPPTGGGGTPPERSTDGGPLNRALETHAACVCHPRLRPVGAGVGRNAASQSGAWSGIFRQSRRPGDAPRRMWI